MSEKVNSAYSIHQIQLLIAYLGKDLLQSLAYRDA